MKAWSHPVRMHYVYNFGRGLIYQFTICAKHKQSAKTRPGTQLKTDPEKNLCTTYTLPYIIPLDCQKQKMYHFNELYKALSSLWFTLALEHLASSMFLA